MVFHDAKASSRVWMRTRIVAAQYRQIALHESLIGIAATLGCLVCYAHRA